MSQYLDIKFKKILWLDDIRCPYEKKWKTLIFDNFKIKDLNGPFHIHWLKNYNEFVNEIEKNGLPFKIYFDHDLGDELGDDSKTGYDCAKYLINYCLDNKLDIPKFYIQSANPAGKENIEKLLNNYHKFFIGDE